MFDQKHQIVERQKNIYYEKAGEASPDSGVSSKALRESYLSRVFQQTGELQLSGIDP
jgi:hypothetical protein